MRTICIPWHGTNESEEGKGELKEKIFDRFGLFINDDKDMIEITFHHDYDFDTEFLFILDIFDNGITLPLIFIPYTNIAFIRLIPAK